MKSIITIKTLVCHYYRLLCAGFCTDTDWAGFVTLLNRRSKGSAKFDILLLPKYSVVVSVLEEFGQRITAELATWGRVIRAANVKAE